MKILFLSLILLASCGKHTEPPAKDLGDNDGDNIRNEKDSRKNIANQPDFGLVKGKIRIQLLPTILELNFSSRTSKDHNFVDLLSTGHLSGRDKLRQVGWSNLIIESSPVPKLILPEYAIDLRFEIENEAPAMLVYEDGLGQHVLGKWESVMQIKLSNEKLEKLLSGFANLRLIKKSIDPRFNAIDADALVRSKTYEVLFDDGKKSVVLEVSNKLSFGQFLKHKNIESAVSISKTDLFFADASEYKTWWYQKLNHRTYVVGLTSLNNLKQKYQERFDKTSHQIVRKNGIGVMKLVAHAATDNRVYFKLRWSRVIKRFKNYERKQTFNQGGGGGGQSGDFYAWECKFKGRKVNGYQQVPSDYDFLKNNLSIAVGGKLTTFNAVNARLELLSDEQGDYLNVGIISNGDKIDLGLLNNLPETYTKIGDLRVKCTNDNKEKALKGERTNAEHQFALEVQSFIEKIE